MKKHYSEKTYGHDLGLSCCFRQWRAASHCHLLHGYALAVRIEFSATELDSNNWVVDFGVMKPIKDYLTRTFDHKMLVASDDPQMEELAQLAGLGLADVIVVERVGCEAFAEMITNFVLGWMEKEGLSPRVTLEKITIKEHGANGASYRQWSNN